MSPGHFSRSKFRSWGPAEPQPAPQIAEVNVSLPWTWTRSPHNVIVSEDGHITFNPTYSSGTAAIRGNEPFARNRHYFWEVQLCTQVYGTDIMVGLGTRNVSLTDERYRFCSLLGLDKEAFGYSYQGYVQHNNVKSDYGPRYSNGSLVGMHLDMCDGTLEFYLNRKPLGVAYTNLKDKELYPMVSSTIANSVVRLTFACEDMDSLQLKCLKLICANSKLKKLLHEVPGLRSLLKQRFKWLIEDTKVNEFGKSCEKTKVPATSSMDLKKLIAKCAS